jgi:hypothetical protein
MRTAVCFALLVVVIAGCNPPEPPGEGEGEGGEGEGEGEGGEGEASEGEGEAGGCDVDGCPDGQECGSIFVGGAVASACYANCDDGSVPCDTAVGGVGECRDIDAFDAPVCRSQAANLAQCGNVVNSGCLDDDAVCVAFDDDALFAAGEATCVRACDEDGDCGDAALACSHDLQFLVSGDGTPHGVCAPPSQAGSPCGRRGDGALALCTGALSCDRADGESQGACAE